MTSKVADTPAFGIVPLRFRMIAASSPARMHCYHYPNAGALYPTDVAPPKGIVARRTGMAIRALMWLIT